MFWRTNSKYLGYKFFHSPYKSEEDIFLYPRNHWVNKHSWKSPLVILKVMFCFGRLGTGCHSKLSRFQKVTIHFGKKAEKRKSSESQMAS